MAWKKLSSLSNTGKLSHVKTNTSFSNNPENIFPNTLNVLGNAIFYSDLTINKNLIFSDISNEFNEFQENITIKNLLNVSGVDISNNLNVSGDAIFYSDVTICGNLINSNNFIKNMTIANKLNASGVDISNNLNVSGDAIFYSDVTICGNLISGNKSYENITIANKLNVSGVDISNNLNVSGDAIFYSDVTICGNLIPSNTFENITIANKLNVSGVDISNNLNVSGDTIFYNDVTICGNLIISDESRETPKNMTITNKLNVSGVDISNNLNVSGDTIFYSDVTICGDLISDNKFFENITISNKLNVSGVDISNNLNVSGSAIFYNDVTICGNLIIKDELPETLENMTITNKLNVSGVDISNNLVVNGDVTMNQNVFYDTQTIKIGATGNISLDTAPGSVFNPEKSNVLLQCLLLFQEKQRLDASEGDAGDEFGYSVAITGIDNSAVAIIGATGVNTKTGAAYIFDICSNTGLWKQKQRLDASGGGSPGDYFGSSVAITGTDNSMVAIIGATGVNTQSGAAYIFDICSNTGLWKQKQRLDASGGAVNNQFGYSAAITGTDNSMVAIIGAPGANTETGAAYIFDICSNTGLWKEKQRLDASGGAANDLFGYSVAITGTDNSAVAIISARGVNTETGAAYIFDICSNTGLWKEKQRLDPSGGMAHDNFGQSVAITGTDNSAVAIIGAHGSNSFEGYSYIFDICSATGDWKEKQRLDASGGAANDIFGSSVAITETDNTMVAIIGAPNANSLVGASYIFDICSATGEWKQKQRLDASGGAANDYFGYSVAITSANNSIIAIIGAPLADINSNNNAGAAYIFQGNSTETFYWDLSNFNSTNQELNIFYDSQQNPNISTQVNFGTNNLATISGLKSDTLFNENGQSISVRCIGSNGNGRWRTANAAPIEDLTVNGNFYAPGVMSQVVFHQTDNAVEALTNVLAGNVGGYISDLSLNITPRSNSIIMIEAQINGEFGNVAGIAANGMFFLGRTIGSGDQEKISAPPAGSRGVGLTVPSLSRNADAFSTMEVGNICYFDQPNTTSQVNYQIGALCGFQNFYYYLNRTVGDASNNQYERTISFISATEITQ